MTREECIDLLDNLKGMIDDSHGNDYDSAFSKAISDIEKLQKIEALYGIDKFGAVLAREERDREVQKILECE